MRQARYLQVVMALILISALHADLRLATNGKTDYVILPPPHPTPIEKLAVKELTTHLQKITGAVFKTATAKTDTCIILEREAGLAPQESRIRTRNRRLILSGGDEAGVLYAVYALLENQFNCRWFTPVGDMRIPRNPQPVLPEMDYREKPRFPYRRLLCFNVFKHPEAPYFALRNRMNLGLEMFGDRLPANFQDSHLFINGSACHTIFFYLPPKKKHNPYEWKWKQEKYYFQDHPDYYSMDNTGKRVTSMQLCFSNPDMRAEFKRRFFERVEMTGKKGSYSISANDCSGKFCHCQACQALEEKYQTHAGPLIDFLQDICKEAAVRFPQIRISTLCYRKEQSEKPPVLPAGQKLPDNLVLIFAPIDDDFSKELTHPNNLDTRENLRDWCRIATNTWVWYYPLPYGGSYAPFGALTRIGNDIRNLLECGATGTFFEHDVNVFNGLNFGDMLTYVMLKQFQKPEADYKAIAREFCQHMYGEAADRVMAFSDDLDSHTQAHKTFFRWANGVLRSAFTPQNLVRWNHDFDQMVTLTEANPLANQHIRQLRIGFDINMLSNSYLNMRKNFPQLPEIKVVENRIRKAWTETMEKRLPGPDLTHWRTHACYGGSIKQGLEQALFDASVVPKPLPAEFQTIAPDRVRQVYAQKVNSCVCEKMEDAAFGQAIWDGKHGFAIPFTCGYYDSEGKRFLLNRSINRAEMSIDAFKLYRLGEAPISTNSYVWMGESWNAGVHLNKLWRPGESNKRYELWISLKFEGKDYSPQSKAKENKVWCDRIVVIEK